MTHEELITEYRNELTAINTAIAAFLSSGGVTEHQAGSRRVKREEMPMLYKRKRELENLLVIEDVGVGRAYAKWAKR